ncbi:peptidylprolyl isomerase [Sphingomonas sp. BIUV-7]|uniref:peptidylprolyl isomerase n=1 Tax=Sphingomonas natans TaxID=3063330 RepID=A0ABT8Y7S1_9SPHN|nr:peptidylprolyl isomerase [Sphingomonas sp. BIUV-7]MDO6413745.1 peptidylprolyl isomerase [Sphingomonas sp. BIUV-7]
MLRAGLAAALLLSLTTPGATAGPRRSAVAPLPKVEIKTEIGRIVIVLEAKRAPITAANFLHYVDAHKFDGTVFYRAARGKSHPEKGLIQGGIDTNIRNSFFPIAHEPTSKTGLKHLDGTVSMARNKPGSAMGDFFITLGAAPGLDAAGDYAGYAAFGHVVSGMDITRRILAMPTYPGGLDIATFGQTIRKPVKIISARRLP